MSKKRPTARDIMRETYHETDIWDLVDMTTVVGCLVIAYGALWVLFGG